MSGSNVITRAMANATPVIASAIGGLPEYLRDFALIIPPNDPNALAQAISKFEEDCALRLKMGTKARLCSFEISWSVISKRTLEIYFEALRPQK